MTNSAGNFIWYELMTPDPDAAAAFYGPVVGWKVEGHSDPQSASDGMDYRMIVRSDGGTAGGVLKLTAQMTAGGPRPAGWAICRCPTSMRRWRPSSPTAARR